MAGTDKKPEIRFTGFTDAWELRKFASTVTRTTSISKENGLPRVEYEDIIADSGTLNKDLSKKESIKAGIEFVNGDILFGKLRPYLKNWLFASFRGIAVGDFWVLTPTDTDGKFIYYLIQTPAFQEVANQSTGTKMPRSDWSIVSKNQHAIPCEKFEQTQIGSFFYGLDRLITLQQRKYDKLVIIKKSMLGKMFPKDGTNVPEIRFVGFTDGWERRELGEVLTERKILQKVSDDAPILAFAAGQGVIDRSERKSNNRDHLTLDPTNKIYLLTEYNDIVYNPSNLKYGAIDRNKHGKGVISPIYVTFTTEEEPSFIELIVKSEKFKLRALQYEEGTVVKRQSVKPENLLTLDVKISSSRDEQKKIGALFEHLDNLITLQQRELEKLKDIKKTLLNKMFV